MADMRQVQAPEGWSKQDDDLGVEGYWGKDEEGQYVAQRHGLQEAKPILIREGGDVLYLFQAGENYYFLDPIQGDVSQIVRPRTLSEIVKAIGQPQEMALVTQSIEQTVSI